jgi:endonuclease/exonuclease/phosphatase family metal-dependent hydrolase
MKVATINFYAGNRQALKDIEFIDSLGFDVVGLQECHNRLEEIVKGLSDHYHVFHHVKANPSRGSRENVSIIRKGRGYKIHSHGSYKVAEAARPIKYAPERYLVWVRFEDERGRKFQHITTHTQPAVQDHSTGKMLSLSIKRVAGYVKGMRAIAKEVRRAKADGFIPLVTGDLNYRRYPGVKNFVLAFWSPQNVFQRTNLAFREHAVDYVAWGPKVKYRREGTIPQSRHGADHDWLWVEVA